MKIYEDLDINDLNGEVWKTISNYPDYQISNFGRIKSFKRDKINGKLMELIKDKKTGYYRIHLLKNKKQINMKVHILVYENFYNDKLKVGECVHHIDKNKENNNYENLEKKLKSKHISDHQKCKIVSEETIKKLIECNIGKHVGEKNHMFGKHHSKETKNKMSNKSIGKYIGENNPSHKLEEWQVKTIYQISNSPIIKQLKITQKEIGEVFGVDARTISAIKNRKIWNYINTENLL